MSENKKLSRRDLIKLTATGAAAMGVNLIPGVKVFAQPAAQGESVTLRFQESPDGSGLLRRVRYASERQRNPLDAHDNRLHP